MEVPPEFGGKPGTSVPQVKPEHLKAAFELYRKYSTMPPQDVAEGADAIQLGHTVGASLPSVSYRATMLELLTQVPQAPLAPGPGKTGPWKTLSFGKLRTFPWNG